MVRCVGPHISYCSAYGQCNDTIPLFSIGYVLLAPCQQPLYVIVGSAKITVGTSGKMGYMGGCLLQALEVEGP